MDVDAAVLGLEAHIRVIEGKVEELRNAHNAMKWNGDDMICGENLCNVASQTKDAIFTYRKGVIHILEETQVV